MLSMQHIMCDVLASDDASKRKNIASLVYPDAIRGYGIPRQVSHFEEDATGKDVSYWSFPANMKTLGQEDIKSHSFKNGHLANDIKTCAIGERSDIKTFYERNKHLPEKMFNGIEAHMKQDIVFDDFIRDKFDCSDKYNDKFVVDGKKLDGKEFRKVIGDVEQRGIYVLAHEIYEKTGETINQEWFEKNVYPVLQEEYSQDLADKTFSFMKIDEHVNELITQHDWSELDKPLHGLKYEDFRALYDDVSNYMNGTDYDKLPSKVASRQLKRQEAAADLVHDESEGVENDMDMQL